MTRAPDEADAAASDEPPSPAPGTAGDEPPVPGPPASRETRVCVEFQAADVAPPARGWLETKLAAAVGHAGLGPVTLALRVVDDEQMSRLHERHSGVTGTTDVLTFDNRDDPGHPIDGDLALCRDEAVRRAEELGHDARLELLLYALHGVLHLDGEDDHTPEAHRRMHEREDRVLAALGLGPVFFPRGASA